MKNADSTELNDTELTFNLDDLGACALFLDFDGTLVDLAPSPEEVVVIPELIVSLQSIGNYLDGRVAIVSGRPISQIDAMLTPLILPVAGVHGLERRDAQGVLHTSSTPAFLAVQICALKLAASYPTLRVEQKRGSLALHYRQAPELEKLCESELLIALRDCPGMTLLPGKMVFEVKPTTITKGTAIQDFLGEVPFAGTRPVFAGDDTTDEVGFAFVQGVGGVGIKIGEGPSVARYRIASPCALRAELASVAKIAQILSKGC